MSDFAAIRREPSLASRVTEELLEAIASGRLRPGDALSTERALSEQFGVSRTVIREAVRGLQAKGVLEITTGRGATVAAVSPTRVAETIELYVRGAQSQELITPADIAEIRSTLEMRLVELACERATDAELAAMAKEVDAMESAPTPEISAIHDEEFHRLLAVATHNALYVTLLSSINAAMKAIRVRSLYVEGRVAEAVAEHRAVLEAALSRDVAQARAAMREHLEDSRHFYNSPAAKGEESQTGQDER